jgi:hypothetical protein
MMREQIRQSELQMEEMKLKVKELDQRLKEKNSRIVKPTWEQIKEVLPLRQTPKAMGSYFKNFESFKERKDRLSAEEMQISVEELKAQFDEILSSTDMRNWYDAIVNWLENALYYAHQQLVKAPIENEYSVIKEIRGAYSHLKFAAETSDYYGRGVELIVALTSAENAFSNAGESTLKTVASAAKAIRVLLETLILHKHPNLLKDKK